ncbi:uncharacterized protein RCC_12004 [Ramularia collo-cygni]|uniref:FAD dependent oxidoreductase domain-containing protein n=1 Tax=Ramularia collo-cygni TaxID=112498 RepID=A0A2D3UR89_9PEZI|nr:uncharacterized protein RCC_12004 [Ramularia collo-cygni]CZT14890.1 uncharacterized protein RCC_12004 [Ramularia collo-cygni]
MAPSHHVVVIGSGVIGLTNAVFLAEAGYSVTIIAAHVPGDQSIEYASPWAGAHWRTHATVDEPVQCDWDVQTFKAWEELLAREAQSNGIDKSESGSGLKMVESIHYWDNEVTEDLWWASHVKDYRELSTSQDPVLSLNKNHPAHAPKILHAATSRAFSINVPQYLLYLQERARAAGVVIFQSKLPSDGGMEKALATAEGISKVLGRGKVDCFVNATGLGALRLCNDNNLYPVRGQTVLVKGEAKATRTRYHGGKIGEGSTSYCIVRPGSGTTILGGTKEKGNWSPSPDPKSTETILQRCSWMVPELLTAEDGGFEVLSVQCGLRPGRTGGPRVERELIGGRNVVHAYGHAGGGYQNSIGSAKDVLKLVNESVDGDRGAEDEIKARL